MRRSSPSASRLPSASETARPGLRALPPPWHSRPASPGGRFLLAEPASWPELQAELKDAKAGAAAAAKAKREAEDNYRAAAAELRRLQAAKDAAEAQAKTLAAQLKDAQAGLKAAQELAFDGARTAQRRQRPHRRADGAAQQRGAEAGRGEGRVNSRKRARGPGGSDLGERRRRSGRLKRKARTKRRQRKISLRRKRPCIPRLARLVQLLCNLLLAGNSI